MWRDVDSIWLIKQVLQLYLATVDSIVIKYNLNFNVS